MEEEEKYEPINLNLPPLDLTKESEYCGYGESEEEYEQTLWDFVQGFISLEEDDILWEHISKCDYCLTQTVNITRAINYVEKENEEGKGYGSAYKELQRILKSREINNIDIEGKKDK